MDHGSSDDDFSDDDDDEEPQESLKEVERRLAARFRADADRESQASRIFKTLAMRARKRAEADGMSSGEYEDVLQQICGVLEDFEGGFNAHLRERKQGQLWWAQH